MGLSPAAEGRKDGREARLSWRGALAQIAVTYRKVGEGRAFNSQSVVPFLKGGGAALGVMVCDRTSTTAAQLT